MFNELLNQTLRIQGGQMAHSPCLHRVHISLTPLSPCLVSTAPSKPRRITNIRIHFPNSKEIKPINPKRINPEYSLEGLVLKLKFQYFGHLMGRADSLEKTLMLEKMAGGRRKRRQRMRRLDGITDSVDMNLNKF